MNRDKIRVFFFSQFSKRISYETGFLNRSFTPETFIEGRSRENDLSFCSARDELIIDRTDEVK